MLHYPPCDPTFPQPSHQSPSLNKEFCRFTANHSTPDNNNGTLHCFPTGQGIFCQDHIGSVNARNRENESFGARCQDQDVRGFFLYPFWLYLGIKPNFTPPLPLGIRLLIRVRISFLKGGNAADKRRPPGSLPFSKTVNLMPSHRGCSGCSHATGTTANDKTLLGKITGSNTDSASFPAAGFRLQRERRGPACPICKLMP